MLTNAEYLTLCKLINYSDLSYMDKFKLRRTAFNIFRKESN